MALFAALSKAASWPISCFRSVCCMEKTSNSDKVSQIYLKLDDPANAAAVVQDLKGKLPD